jgi:hypothetical protein
VRLFNFSVLVTAPAILCLSQPALALQSCPTTVKTVPLTSTVAVPLTHTAINTAINNASSSVTTELSLSGTFNVGDRITVPIGKNCITLKSASTPATLKWAAPASSKQPLLFALGNYGITLKNLVIEGRDVALAPANNGDAYSTIDGVTFNNPTSSDTTVLSVIRLFAAPGGVTGKGWKISNNKFVLTVGNGTGIMGYLGDGVTITGNTFTNVDEAVHFQGISNAVISNNTGTGLVRSAFELQEGYAMNPPVAFKNTTITIDRNTFTKWRSGPIDVTLGISIAGGSGVTVSNNTLITNGSSLTECQNKPLQPVAWERWGIEFTAVNSSASGNTLCGFDWGIRIGYFGTKNFTSGTDLTTISNNTLANMYLAGIDLFPGDTSGFGGYGQLTDNSGNVVETPLAAKSRLAGHTEAINRQLKITGNIFNNNRIVAVANGKLFLNQSPVLINNQWTTVSRVPDTLASHLSYLEISKNTINRTYGFFATDTTATAAYYNDQRFIGLAIPAIRTAKNLGVYYNNINLSNAPAAGALFLFRGMEINPLISEDDGKNYDPAKNFIKSGILLNKVTAGTNQFGSGFYTNDLQENTWQGLALQGNTLNNLAIGIHVERNWPRPDVVGNTCTAVAIPGPGC